MGQSKTKPASFFRDKLQKTILNKDQVNCLSYIDFKKALDELNDVSCTLSDISGKRLIFEIQRDSDQSFAWKSLVRIKCSKINEENGFVDSIRILTLRQFVNLYNIILQHAETMSASLSEIEVGGTGDSLKETTIDTSIFLSRLDESSSNECCICMDRESDIILPCMHSFCQQCISTWHVKHDTCPVCRNQTANEQEQWVMPNVPNNSEVAGYLMQVTEEGNL